MDYNIHNTITSFIWGIADDVIDDERGMNETD